MSGQSQQVMLDSFFGSLSVDGLWRRGVSDWGFAKAWDRLKSSCLSRLNAFVVERADAMGLLARWRGKRIVAADDSVLMPAVRPCFTRRRSADVDLRLFCVYLPGAEITQHASVHAAHVAERQMLFRALACLGPDDVLVLDRGYPAAWLMAHLNEKGIRFCMRCDKGNGWVAMKAFIRSGLPEAVVTLNAPNKRDAQDYECSRCPPHVRLVRQVTPNGLIRVLATHLHAQAFPCEVFAELYQQRWRIEEGFKRLKHCARLECVSGLKQHAVLVDVAAKVRADNLSSVVCQAALQEEGKDGEGSDETVHPLTPAHVCNWAYAFPLL